MITTNASIVNDADQKFSPETTVMTFGNGTILIEAISCQASNKEEQLNNENVQVLAFRSAPANQDLQPVQVMMVFKNAKSAHILRSKIDSVISAFEPKESPAPPQKEGESSQAKQEREKGSEG